MDEDEQLLEFAREGIRFSRSTDEPLNQEPSRLARVSNKTGCENMTTQDVELRTGKVPSVSQSGSIAASVAKMAGDINSRLGRRGLLLLGIAVVGAGTALNWSWFVALGVAPVILSVLPCAAMCAIGMCTMGRGDTSCSKNRDAPANTNVAQGHSGDPSAPRP